MSRGSSLCLPRSLLERFEIEGAPEEPKPASAGNGPNRFRNQVSNHIFRAFNQPKQRACNQAYKVPLTAN